MSEPKQFDKRDALLRAIQNLLRRNLWHGLLRAESEVMIDSIEIALSTPSAGERIDAVRADQAGEPISAKQAGMALAQLGRTRLDAMVDRFLNWLLPMSVMPDGCVMNRMYPRIGTNLLTADEARQMLEHVLAGVTSHEQPLNVEAQRSPVHESPGSAVAGQAPAVASAPSSTRHIKFDAEKFYTDFRNRLYGVGWTDHDVAVCHEHVEALEATVQAALNLVPVSAIEARGRWGDAERYRARRWMSWYLSSSAESEAEHNRKYDEASDAEVESDQYRAATDGTTTP